MKKRIFNKKLTLNKKTIATLTDEEMTAINGGYPISGMTECPECPFFTYQVGCTNRNCY